MFQENEGGCWVAKVFPTGNAALHCQGDKVEIGDQLAEVDGTSTIRMDVDDICSLFAAAADPTEIELTFLRYVGPFHPMQVATKPKRGEAALMSHQGKGWRNEPNNGISQKRQPAKERRFRWFGRQKTRK